VQRPLQAAVRATTCRATSPYQQVLGDLAFEAARHRVDIGTLSIKFDQATTGMRSSSGTMSGVRPAAARVL